MSHSTKKPLYITRLEEINAAADKEGLYKLWADFKRDIDPRTSVDAPLWHELVKDDQKGINDFFSDWIRPGQRDESKPAYLASIRLLSRVGQEPKYASLIFERLWELVVDDSLNTDIRAWALYSMHHCNLELNSDGWRETFGSLYGSGGLKWLQSVPEDEVRFWAFYAIAQMARNSRVAICWRSLTKDHCDKKLTFFRLSADLFPEVEALILDQWSREIDVDVRARHVNSLGSIAGWNYLPESETSGWSAISILKEAAVSEYTRLNSHVPSAICGIAENILHRGDITPKQRQYALQQLVDLTSMRASNLLAFVRENEQETDRFGNLYNQQRGYLMVLREIARVALDAQVDVDVVVPMCVTGLLEVADTALNGASTVSIRLLALSLLNDLARGDSRVPNSLDIVEKSALAKYKLMLGDPEPEIVRAVASNITTLIGDKRAAEHFVNVILDPDSKDVNDAIHHYEQNTGGDQKTTSLLTSGERDFFQQKIRKAAAQALATIPENNEAHDLLVETLRSDSMRSSLARDALIAMGGQKAIDSMVQYSLQRLVQDKYFEPIEEARKKGWQLLDDVRFWSNSNYQFAYRAANFSLLIGLGLIVVGVIYLLNPGSTKENVRWVLGSGALATVAGIVGTFFWEPAKALNKVESELTRIILSFENYLGRMRLIGLGFAHAFSTENWNQLHFLESISRLSGQAMRESTVALEDIGKWPNYKDAFDKPYIMIPTLVGKSLDEAGRLVDAARLKLEVSSPEFRENYAVNSIISQEPPPGVYVAEGATIKVVPSATEQPKVQIPDFMYKPIPEALNLAQQKRLVVSEIAFKFDDKIEEGRVIKQEPVAKSNVPEGKEVILTISKGNMPSIKLNGSTTEPVNGKAIEREE